MAYLPSSSLALLDTLDKFVTVTDGAFVFRFHADEAAVMREHALPLAKDALATLSRTWRFTPKGPLLIEMFPKHDDFAVRNLGLPGMVGALGACFGRVVTMDSPRARPPGHGESRPRFRARRFSRGRTGWRAPAARPRDQGLRELGARTPERARRAGGDLPRHGQFGERPAKARTP